MAIDVNVPVATNQVSADLTAMAANMKLIVCGDGTAGRVLRLSKLTIADGTNLNTLKLKMDSVWNGDDVAEEDNIYNATGGTNLGCGVSGPHEDWFRIYIKNVGINGDAVAVLNTTFYSNNSGLLISVAGSVDSTGMILDFKDSNSGLSKVLYNEMGSSDVIIIYITYLTSA